MLRGSSSFGQGHAEKQGRALRRGEVYLLQLLTIIGIFSAGQLVFGDTNPVIHPHSEPNAPRCA